MTCPGVCVYVQYKQQLTIFIVGYQDVCGQKLKLLAQVNDVSMLHRKEALSYV